MMGGRGGNTALPGRQNTYPGTARSGRREGINGEELIRGDRPSQGLEEGVLRSLWGEALRNGEF